MFNDWIASPHNSLTLARNDVSFGLQVQASDLRPLTPTNRNDVPKPFF